MLSRIPRWLITLVVLVIVIILLALLLAALGGAEWLVQIGHFHWQVGVTKS